ncbi:MAG TPA: hypothetical protein VNZ26_29710 [Vicinamibacterales bacterium]|jgi:hypothetical protein|nr:hypothetical protein [Vicinamibacterales bacterium]
MGHENGYRGDNRLRRDLGPIVAGMATMPSRGETLPLALASIIGQVDRLYLYLDGHDEVPSSIREQPKVTPILSRHVPDLRGAGKLLGLTLEPAQGLFVSVDDDILYPDDYVASLCEGLRAQDYRAVVGYHGSILTRPFIRYSESRTVFYFAEALRSACRVDVLGAGTVMFAPEVLRFDVRQWPDGLHVVDLRFAIEAAKRSVPLICLDRPDDYVRPLALGQPDSAYASLKNDDSRQSALALELLHLTGKSA